ncbi:MAG: hypothetical protein SOW59_05825 [Corynebacterium sp.]|nr:hypothetical protein [Corynebacterium sp.]
MISRFIPRTVGLGAGIVALYIVVFAFAGGLWGALRPTMTVSVRDDGLWVADSPATAGNVEFAGFGSFVLLTGLLAAVLSVFLYVQVKTWRGLLMLAVTGALSLVGAWIFWFIGAEVSAVLVRDNAESLTLAPPFRPGIGLIFAPWMAMIVFWCALYIDFDGEKDISCPSGQSTR